jgi:hypothetical protein
MANVSDNESKAPLREQASTLHRHAHVTETIRRVREYSHLTLYTAVNEYQQRELAIYENLNDTTSSSYTSVRPIITLKLLTQ